MPVPKYYCDYCDKQFQDTPGDRKRHERGIQHQQAKARWYDSFKLEEEQQYHLSNAQSSQGLPKPLCYHFVNTGFCRFSGSCRYFHPNANNVPQPSMISAPNNMLQPTMMSTPNNMLQPLRMSHPAPINMLQPAMRSAPINMPQPSMMSAPNNISQSSMISASASKGNVVQDGKGISWENLPPSLQPPPEGGYPSLPFVDWG